VLSRKADAGEAALELTLEAGPDTPVVNPAIVVQGWGDATPRLQIDGQATSWGKEFRFGLVRTLEGTDLVVWMEKNAARPVRVKLTAAK
jgi:hypothetical protein